MSQFILNDQCVNSIVEILISASNLLISLQQSPLSITTKPDGSKLCNADLASHTELISSFSKLVKSGLLDVKTIISEESDPDLLQRAANDLASGDLRDYLLLDPLDGTSSYINGSAEYTINLAIIKDGQLRAGFIACPARQEIYYGSLSDICSLQRKPESSQNKVFKYTFDGKKHNLLRTSSAPNTHLNQPVGPWNQIIDGSAQLATSTDRICVVSRRNKLHYLGFKEIKRISSALKFCMIANGEADVYVQPRSLAVWDIMAGEAIVRALGGEVHFARTSYFNPTPDSPSAEATISNSEVGDEVSSNLTLPPFLAMI